MLKIKNLRGECQHCGGELEFHAEHTGSVAECPHCAQQTELLLPVPEEEPSPLWRKAIVFTVVVALIVGGGWVGVGIALKRAKELKAGQQPVVIAPEPVNPFGSQEFQASPVALNKDAGGTLAYAVGTITNLSGRQRFGVRVEVALTATDGAKLVSASDYTKVIEPNATWTFRALVSDRRAVAVKVAAISESR